MAQADGKITVNGSGHAAIGPMKVDIDEFKIVTNDKFQPLEAAAQGKMGQILMNVKTTFADGKAKNEVNNGQGPQTKEDDVHADAIVVYNPFPFYPWTVLAMRTDLKTQDPQQFPVYVLNQGEVPATVVFKGREPVEFAGKTVELNHIVATGKTPQGQALSLDFWVDDNRKLIKIAVPSQGVEGYQEGFDRKAPAEAVLRPMPSSNRTTPQEAHPIPGSEGAPDFRAALECYLSSILDIADMVSVVFPELSTACLEQLSRLRARLAFEANKKTLDESRDTLHQILEGFSISARALYAGSRRGTEPNARPGRRE